MVPRPKIVEIPEAMGCSILMYMCSFGPFSQRSTTNTLMLFSEWCCAPQTVFGGCRYEFWFEKAAPAKQSRVSPMSLYFDRGLFDAEVMSRHV